MILRERLRSADNQGVTKLWWPGAAVAAAVLCLGLAQSGGLAVSAPIAIAGAGGCSVIAGAAAVGVRRRTRHDFADGGLVGALRSWDHGDLDALQVWVSDLVGTDAAAHAARTASLCQHMGDQLAVRPESMDDLVLAALAHVTPAAFETADGACPGYSPEALNHAGAAVSRAGHAEAAMILAQVGERWDGRGKPNGLLGEAASLRGRILATACAFDLASRTGLEDGLAAIREGSGSVYDPVVAAELLHLFREPWQLRQAA